MIYRALAHPIANVGQLETRESLRQRIAQRRSVVGPFDQYLDWLVCGVYKVRSCNRTYQGPVHSTDEMKFGGAVAGGETRLGPCSYLTDSPTLVGNELIKLTTQIQWLRASVQPWQSLLHYHQSRG